MKDRFSDFGNMADEHDKEDRHEQAIQNVNEIIREHSPEEILKRVKELKKSLDGTPNGLNLLALGVLISTIMGSAPDSEERTLFAHHILRSLERCFKLEGIL